MEYRQFIVPSDREVLEAIGIEPVSDGGDPATRLVRFITEAGDIISLSYDAPGRSVRVQWSRNNRQILDLFREGAERLVFESNSATVSVSVQFKTDSNFGTLHIQFLPEVFIKDDVLLV
jgi:YD repeat-containing protein